MDIEMNMRHEPQHMSENTSDAASQYLLGFLYASGLKGVEQDQSRVSSWFAPTLPILGRSCS
jgi:TPR repeat protein